MDFDPNLGYYLAYPNNNSVIVLNTSDWSKKYTFTTETVKGCYSIVQFSPCGNYIAAATDQGDLVVWEVATQILVDATTHPKSVSICAMVWNPAGNFLQFYRSLKFLLFYYFRKWRNSLL